MTKDGAVKSIYNTETSRSQWFSMITICPIPANTKHLYSIYSLSDQRRRRWAKIVQMLNKGFVFAGMA